MASNFPKSEMKSRYLEQNSKHTLLENLGPSAFNFDKFENEDDYELWLVQCPTNINLEEELHEQSIKLPGKTSINKIETISEVLSSPKPIILSYKADENEYSVKSLSALGRIIIREKLKVVRDEVDTNGTNEINSSCVTFPINLKQRHPLLGADFEDKLKLDKNIINRLQNCNIKVEPLEIKKEIKTEFNDFENFITSVEQKTKKKKKRKAIDNNQIQVKPKKIRKDIVSTNGDVESSLAWIKNL